MDLRLGAPAAEGRARVVHPWPISGFPLPARRRTVGSLTAEAKATASELTDPTRDAAVARCCTSIEPRDGKRTAFGVNLRCGGALR